MMSEEKFGELTEKAYEGDMSDFTDGTRNYIRSRVEEYESELHEQYASVYENEVAKRMETAKQTFAVSYEGENIDVAWAEQESAERERIDAELEVEEDNFVEEKLEERMIELQKEARGI